MALKLRRGLNSERLTVTPAEGELVFTTDTKQVYVGDGNTVGGILVGEGGTFSSINATSITVNTITANTANINSGLNVSGHILPTANQAYDIGSNTLRFRDLYLSGNTIDLGGATLSTNAENGTMAFVPVPTPSNPNPVALVVSPSGALFTVNTSGGSINSSDITSGISSNSGITLQPNLPIDISLTTENVNTTGSTSNTLSTTGRIQFNIDDGLNVVSSGNTNVVRLSQALKTTSNVTFNTVQHSGLVMTEGTNVDQYYELNQMLQLTDDWQDTSITSTALPTGTYVVQIYANDAAAGGGHTHEYYSGLMSWYSSDTDSTVFDEIALHRAGQGPGSGIIFLRVQRTLTANANDLKLQISSTLNTSSLSLYTFKFRRML